VTINGSPGRADAVLEAVFEARYSQRYLGSVTEGHAGVYALVGLGRADDVGQVADARDALACAVCGVESIRTGWRFVATVACRGARLPGGIQVTPGLTYCLQ
jgi:hypothetical protein